MWRWLGIIAGLIVVAVIAVLWGILINKPSSSSSTWQPIELTSDNLPSNLERFKPVQEMPESGVIGLIIGDEKYTIVKGRVSRGEANDADIIISLPKSYFEIMGEHGWCSALQTAQARGELGVSMEDSKTSLLLRYGALAKYKSCFGL